MVLYLLNCALFNTFFCVQETKYKQKRKVHELPAWGRKVLDFRSPELKWVQFWWPSIATEEKPQGDLNRTTRQTLRWFQNTKTWKNIWWWGGKKEVSCRTVERMLHIWSEVKLDTFINSELFRFTKVLFWEIPFSDKLLDYLYAVSAVWGSGA